MGSRFMEEEVDKLSKLTNKQKTQKQTNIKTSNLFVT
jgi:hypothetical protein